MKLYFCSVFGNIKRIRRQDTEWKKIFAKNTFNKKKKLHSIYKELEKAREFLFFTSALLTAPKPTVWITINCGTMLKRWEYQTNLPAS